MSILNAITGGLGVITQLANVRNTLRGGTAAGQMQLGQLMIPGGAQQLLQPSLPALPGSGFTTGGGFGGTGSRFPGTASAYGPPSGFHFAKDGSGRIVRNRRMNPLNASAARRAIRRIKGARKMLQSIERSLPKRAAPRTTRKR